MDDIINNQGTDRADWLERRANTYFAQEGISAKHEYAFKYLDLVDQNNGNIPVNASEDVTITWPIPEGVDKDSSFTVLHFKDLHREHGDHTPDAIDNCTVEEIKPTVENGNITFTIHPRSTDENGNITGGFSPFALAWKDQGDDIIVPPDPDPDTPVDPNTPVAPNTPVVPDTSVVPDNPVDPNTPVVPDTPVKPDSPAETNVQEQPNVGNTLSNSPKTNDTSMFELWIAVACVSFIALLGTYVGKKFVVKNKK